MTEGRGSFDSAFFSVILGVFLALMLIVRGFSASAMLPLVMGVFWPYLSLRRNIFLGSIQFLLLLPSTYRLCSIAYMEASILVTATDEVLGLAYDAWFINAYVASVPVVVMAICFVAPYVFYRLFRRWGLYKRLPWGFSK